MSDVLPDENVDIQTEESDSNIIKNIQDKFFTSSEEDQQIYRAKIFKLVEGEEWDGILAGPMKYKINQEDKFEVTITNSENPNEEFITSIDRSNPSVTFNSEFFLCWRSEDNIDYSITFEKEAGFNFYLSEFNEYQNSVPKLEIPAEVTLEDLPTLLNTLMKCQSSPMLKQVASEQILANEPNFTNSLVDIFHTCEDLGGKSDLFLLFEIMKNIVLLNNPDYLALIVKDAQLFVDIVGFFEHDPEYPNSEVSYRNYLTQGHLFKQILPIKDPHLVSLIHAAFRANYLKDVVLNRILDDSTFSRLSIIIRLCHKDIIERLLNLDSNYLTEIIDLMTESEEQRNQGLCFLKEFISLSSGYSQQHNEYMKALNLKKLLPFLVKCMEIKDCCDLAVDVFVHLVEHDAKFIRKSLIENQLFGEIVKKIQIKSIETSTLWELSYLIKALTDPTFCIGESLSILSATVPTLSNDFESFLEAIYPNSISTLFYPLRSLTKIQIIGSDFNQDLCFHLCELFCLFIKHHRYRIKYLILTGSLISNTLELLLCHNNKPLALAALRVLKAIVFLNDDFYHRYLIKNNCFARVFDAFYKNEFKDNLMQSSIFDLFEYIVKNKPYLLLNYLNLNFNKEITEYSNFAPTFARLLSAIEAAPMESEPEASSELAENVSSDFNKKRETMDKTSLEEDEYFREDDFNEAPGQGEENLNPPSFLFNNRANGNGSPPRLTDELDFAARLYSSKTPSPVSTPYLKVGQLTFQMQNNKEKDKKDEDIDTGSPVKKAKQ